MSAALEAPQPFASSLAPPALTQPVLPEPATMPFMQPASQPALQPAVAPPGQPNAVQQALMQGLQWFNLPAGPQTQTAFAQSVPPVNSEPSPSVGMLSPYQYEEVKPVFVQSAPSPGDDGRFDESDRVKSFIQGLRGPSPRSEAAGPLPAAPAVQSVA